MTEILRTKATETRVHYMACDDPALDFMMDLDEFARRLGIKPRRAETDAPVKMPDPNIEPSEISVRKGNFEVYVPRASSDSAKPGQSTPAAKPKDDVIDLYAEREARFKGEVSEREIEEAKPERDCRLQEAFDLGLQMKEREIAERDATSKGNQLPQWIPCASSAQPPDTIDLFRENTQRRASEAIGQKADDAEGQAHAALMAWYEKRKAQNK